LTAIIALVHSIERVQTVQLFLFEIIFEFD